MTISACSFNENLKRAMWLTRHSTLRSLAHIWKNNTKPICFTIIWRDACEVLREQEWTSFPLLALRSCFVYVCAHEYACPVCRQRTHARPPRDNDVRWSSLDFLVYLFECGSCTALTSRNKKRNGLPHARVLLFVSKSTHSSNLNLRLRYAPLIYDNRLLSTVIYTSFHIGGCHVNIVKEHINTVSG